MKKATSQNHGIIWENQVIGIIEDKFKTTLDLTGYSPTAKWDIPGNNKIGLLPVSVKAQKGRSISNGSAIRTFQTSEDFMLAVCFYNQNGKNKEVVSSDLIVVTKETWNTMKGDLKVETITKLEQKLKTFKKGEHVEARKWYKTIKRRYLNKINTSFQIAFKVDSNSQRRIQASFKIDDLHRINNTIRSNTNILGLSDIVSKPRVFNK